MAGLLFWLVEDGVVLLLLLKAVMVMGNFRHSTAVGQNVDPKNAPDIRQGDIRLLRIEMK